MVRDHKLTLHDLLVEILIVLASEWEAATKESKQEDSTGPDVCWRAAEFFLGHNLRGHVGWGATEYLDFFIVRDTGTEAKIDYFDVTLGIKHHVLELNISVANTFAVAVLKSANHLSVNPSRIILVHSAIGFGFKETMSGSAGNVFHN
jgi:hypothetical protein